MSFLFSQLPEGKDSWTNVVLAITGSILRSLRENMVWRFTVLLQRREKVKYCCFSVPQRRRLWEGGNRSKKKRKTTFRMEINISCITPCCIRSLCVYTSKHFYRNMTSRLVYDKPQFMYLLSIYLFLYFSMYLSMYLCICSTLLYDRRSRHLTDKRCTII